MVTMPTVVAPKSIIPSIAATDLALAASKLAIQLRIFVAGPYISKAWPKKVLAKQSESAKLRIALIEYIERELHHSATLGEHRGVAEMAEKNFESLATVVLSEMAMVEEAECVVILPCSPGSFCELGAWSTRDDISRKMLILAEKKYEHEKSYIKLGVFKLAEDAGARVEWVDYKDTNSVKAVVKEHVGKAHSLALRKKVLRGPK